MTANSVTQSDLHRYFQSIGQQARCASRVIAAADTGVKNKALIHIAKQLMDNSAQLLAQNAQDLEDGEAKQLSAALLDRLALDTDRIEAMSEGLRQIAALPDPVGELIDMSYRPSGIQVGKMRVPLGVIGIIYESRPNVTADAAALCLKSGNAAILRGGSEAIHSNSAIAQCIATGLEAAGLPSHSIQVLNNTDRTLVDHMITAEDYVDIIIPRGGKGLIERISKQASVPVIKHLDGICHVYIDNDADIEKASKVAYNAKARRYGVCGAMETLLIHADVTAQTLQTLEPLFQDKGVELRACERSIAHLSNAKPACEADWSTEYLDSILSIKVVDDIEAAITHINQYGSGHTDSILTESLGKANQFLREVDSSSVMVNASTQFADGFEYGLGAEIGISTNKLHVRGPVGLEGLTCQKYIVIGDGHIRP